MSDRNTVGEKALARASATFTLGVIRLRDGRVYCYCRRKHTYSKAAHYSTHTHVTLRNTLLYVTFAQKKKDTLHSSSLSYRIYENMQSATGLQQAACIR